MFAPRVSMFLVSITARVSNSAISSGFFGRSTNSRSQLTENFIFRRSHPERSRGIPWSCLNVMQRDVSTSLDMTTICSRELFQKAQVILREEPNIRNFEKNHCQPIHAEPECIATPFFRIVSIIATRFVDRFKNSRMHHAAAGHFDPLLAAFESFRSDVNLQTWLGKREEMRSKLHFGVGAKEFPHEKFELAFQI